MEAAAVSETRIGSAEFGDYHYVEFLKWTFGDRQSKAALLRNLAAARTDANKDLIAGKIAFYMKLYKLTEEELLEKIIEADRKNVSIAKLHQQLAEAAGVEVE